MAKFIGYISIEENAMFEAPARIARNGQVISVSLFELKDGINADCYVIGEEYDITGLCK